VRTGLKQLQRGEAFAPSWRRTLGEVPRPPRIAPPGGIFHVSSRGNRRQQIFVDDGDRRWFLRLFGAAVSRFRWKCHAYCLMDNHFHLLVETPEENLSDGMQWLPGRYAKDFNWRHGYDGHLFQGRFKSQLVESNWHLIELGRYIVLNPVRAGMRATAAEWPWSSYMAAVGDAAAPAFLTLDWLLAQFGRNRPAARDSYARFVAETPIRASP
jgi:REP element-mobilizing transposase RayT